jgi:hypothetical protein
MLPVIARRGDAERRQGLVQMFSTTHICGVGIDAGADMRRLRVHLATLMVAVLLAGTTLPAQSLGAGAISFE